MDEQKNRIMKILWAVCLIPLLVGLILIASSECSVTYSTSEYWVAKDYHHVYEKYSGEIVDTISENEECEIDGDEIIVTKVDKTLRSWGNVLTMIFVFCTFGMIWITFEDKLTSKS